MPRFLTIFPFASNVELIKDVGMIPYILNNKYNYDSTIASYKNGDYPYIFSEVNGLKQIFIKKRTKHSTIDSLLFVFSNFSKFDVLQTYHLNRSSLLILFFFKLLKKITFSKSYTYLKLDASDDIKRLDVSFLEVFFLKTINLVSIETKGLYNFLNEKKNIKKKVEYIPNGFYDAENKETIDFNLKENLIITVGRIGAFEKNNETLLEAFKNFALKNKDWNLEVIGSIEKDFQNYIDSYFKDNPHLSNRVFFTGKITDREVLKQKYVKAKIFVLSSRIEGFPLVYLESIKAGCTIISSAITPAFDITDNEKFGALFPIGDAKALEIELEKAISNSAKLERDCLLIQQFAYENFYWPKICANIDFLIKNEM